jgi:hypothetical protein
MEVLCVFLCPSVHYPLPCYQRLNSRKGFNFLFACLFRFERKIRLSLILVYKGLKRQFACDSKWAFPNVPYFFYIFCFNLVQKDFTTNVRKFWFTGVFIRNESLYIS